MKKTVRKKYQDAVLNPVAFRSRPMKASMIFVYFDQQSSAQQKVRPID
jgi:hypothetical protein